MDLFPNSDYINFRDDYRVENGEVTFTLGSENQRRIEAAYMTWIREIEDIFVHANVQLINTILPESDWKIIFPQAAPQDYMFFLRAAAQYPAFCNEFDHEFYPSASGWTQEHSCKRELATLFAHISYETGDKADWQTGLSLDQE